MGLLSESAQCCVTTRNSDMTGSTQTESTNVTCDGTNKMCGLEVSWKKVFQTLGLFLPKTYLDSTRINDDDNNNNNNINKSEVNNNNNNKTETTITNTTVTTAVAHTPLDKPWS